MTNTTKNAAQLCGTCRRPVTPGTACIVFTMHHARCIARVIARERTAF